MDSLYGVVESIVLFLKSPIPTAGQLIAKDMDETSDMCLLLTYLFADFFLRLEASEEQIKRYKKNFGLIYGTFLSIMDAWSEDMCPALSRKAAKFVRKVEAFSTKHGIELKELDDGMIVAWPKYPSEFETEQSRLLEPGMLPKFVCLAYALTWPCLQYIRWMFLERNIRASEESTKLLLTKTEPPPCVADPATWIMLGLRKTSMTKTTSTTTKS